MTIHDPTTVARFLSHWHRESLDPAACWLWDAYTNRPKPYGRFRLDGKLEVAHRVAYRMFVGPIPDGLTLDHLCRRPRCVNPFHLEPVTVTENIRRGTQGWNMRQRTHCPRGHAYDAANTWTSKAGSRHCRTCIRERMRARRARA